MNHDVFISYSSKNKVIADAVCHVLEEQGIKCWIAPRDILPGTKYGAVIEHAIVNCRVCVFIFSEDSKLSPWCESELNIAFSDRKIIIPFKIDESVLDGEMRMMLNNRHWIEAFPNPEQQLKSLLESLQSILGKQTIKEEEITSKTIIRPSAMLDMANIYASIIPYTNATHANNSFSMSKFPITQLQYETIMGHNPSFFSGNKDNPVEQVSWYDAIEFCNALSRKQGLEECYSLVDNEVICNFYKKGYRLPTCVEWRIAASEADEVAIEKRSWYAENSNCTTQPVGLLQPCKKGIWDLFGNVYEWCWDWGSPENEHGNYLNYRGPKYPDENSLKVLRGGDFHSTEEQCEDGVSIGVPANTKDKRFGFRVVISGDMSLKGDFAEAVKDFIKE